MRKLLISILSLICVVVIASCSDDDTDYVPSYRTDLLCLLTNGDSLATDLLLDDGRRFSLSQRVYTALPNSMLRCLCRYTINDDSAGAHIYDITKVSCYTPAPADSFEVHPQEPVNVVSLWKSGGFINLCLSPLVISKTSVLYDFSIDSVTQSADSKTIMHTSFLFQRKKESVEAYSTKLYHSIPLHSSAYPCTFDSMYIYVNTYEGMKVYPFGK